MTRRVHLPFTKHRDGWVRWYKGRTRFICSKNVPADEIEDRWIELKHAIDRTDAKIITVPRFGVVSLKDVAGQFLARQRRRMETGRPKPLSPFTFHDYVRAMGLLRDVFGAQCDLTELGPHDFMRLAKRFDDKAPSTLTRTIAYVKAFFAWAHQAGVLAEPPNYGPDFVKPPAQARRDHRLAATKMYTPEEIQAIWKAADRVEKCWIALGLNCAFDNSDIASLTRDVVDLGKGIIDFRRRKVGRIRRVCPLHSQTVKLLKAYRRPKAASAAFEDRFFLSPLGKPLVRVQPLRADDQRSSQINAISAQWKRLLSRSGIRGKLQYSTLATGANRTVYPKGDGRGFRSLRTTFANLAPHGFMEEVEIIMGHSHGSVLLDSYLEEVGHARLQQLVDHVWRRAFTSSPPQGQVRRRRGTGAS